MTTILNVPIEPLDIRYTKQWDTWFLTQFRYHKELFVHTIYGDNCSGEIEHGGFLDLIDTNEYKLAQLQKILVYLRTYDDSYPLVLFFHDIWFPGIQAISYIRDGMEWKNLRIMGCLHSGSYEPQDYITLKGMAKWGEGFENSIFKLVDKVFVATEFHKRIVIKYRDAVPEKIKVTGFPIYPPKCQPVKKEKIVVFPHRLNSEKQPNLFLELEKRFKEERGENTGWQFIRTQDIHRTKEEYYNLLNRSYIAISFALHENWGIGMQEALFQYNIPLCPNRLSYRELYDNLFLYEGDKKSDIDSIYSKFLHYIDQYPNIPQLVHYNRKVLLEKGKQAIGNMINEML